jgi:hypothetical protein
VSTTANITITIDHVCGVSGIGGSGSGGCGGSGGGGCGGGGDGQV